jgi:hypothetical protein
LLVEVVALRGLNAIGLAVLGLGLLLLGLAGEMSRTRGVLAVARVFAKLALGFLEALGLASSGLPNGTVCLVGLRGSVTAPRPAADRGGLPRGRLLLIADELIVRRLLGRLGLTRFSGLGLDDARLPETDEAKREPAAADLRWIRLMICRADVEIDREGT